MVSGELVAFVSFYISLIEFFHHPSIFSSRVQRNVLLNETLRTQNDYSNGFSLWMQVHTHAITIAAQWMSNSCAGVSKDWLCFQYSVCMIQLFWRESLAFECHKAIIIIIIPWIWMNAEYVWRNQLWLWIERCSCFGKCYSKSNWAHYDELFFLNQDIFKGKVLPQVILSSTHPQDI